MSLEVIAEAGSNHNGEVDRCKLLAKIAAESGASSIKFQFIYPDGLYIPQYVGAHGSQPNEVHEQRAKEVLTKEQWRSVWHFCEGLGLEVFASVFCEEGVALLSDLGARTVKVASTDLNNPDLILLCLQRFKRCILSTGMSYLGEIEDALDWIAQRHPLDNLELMHCVSSYPCVTDDSNLRRIQTLRSAFGLPVGYSDHTQTADSAVAALALGCRTFEKHFTFDKDIPGFDHKYASDPSELCAYITSLGAVNNALKPSSCVNSNEAETRVRARRGVYAARALEEGEVLSRDDLLVVRPSNSCGPGDISSLIGQRVSEKIKKYQGLRFNPAICGEQEVNERAVDYWANEMADKGMQ